MSEESLGARPPSRAPVDTPRSAAVDPELLPFLEAEDAGAADALSALLVERAGPLARRVASAQLRHLPRVDVEDAVATVLARLTRRLSELRADPEARAIKSFGDYVAKASYNACHEVLRQLAPRRAALAARLRYLARRGVVLRLETAPGGDWRCLPAAPPPRERGETSLLVVSCHFLAALGEKT